MGCCLMGPCSVGIIGKLGETLTNDDDLVFDKVTDNVVPGCGE